VTSADVWTACGGIRASGSYLSFDLLLHDHSEYPQAIARRSYAMTASQITWRNSHAEFRLGSFMLKL